MQFVPTLLLMLFSAVFSVIWLIDKHKKYLLSFSLSFICFGFGLLIQNLELPLNKLANVLVSSALYFAGAHSLAEGVLIRSNRHYSRSLAVSIVTIFFIALIYVTYEGSSYFIVANTVYFGVGTIILAGCLQALFLWHGTIVERVFFIIFSLLSIHFFSRTFLTVGFTPNISELSSLGTSGFWTIISVMNSLVSVIIGLAIVALVTGDIISALDNDRDTDPLTGLLNRRGLNRFMTTQTKQECLSIFVVDIDYFKRINDEFGHQTGDATLIHFANILKSMSGFKAISRVGGEEFVLLISGNSDNVWYAGDSLRARVANHQFPDIVDGFKITCSIGITEIEPNENIWSAFARADKGLLTAKQDGRNRIVTAYADAFN